MCSNIIIVYLSLTWLVVFYLYFHDLSYSLIEVVLYSLELKYSIYEILRIGKVAMILDQVPLMSCDVGCWSLQQRLIEIG